MNTIEYGACSQCGQEIGGYESGGAGLCQSCDGERRYEAASGSGALRCWCGQEIQATRKSYLTLTTAGWFEPDEGEDWHVYCEDDHDLGEFDGEPSIEDLAAAVAAASREQVRA